MQFNIIFKTIFEYIHKKFRFVHTKTFCKYRKKLRASPRVHLVISRNTVFFRTFLYFESIHKISVRHSKIIYISGIRQRNILSFTSFCRSRCPLFHSKFIFKKSFFVVLSPLQRDKSGFVLLPCRNHF